MKIISVLGAPPNFNKIAPFIKSIKAHNELYADSIKQILILTGQHYDDRMSWAFLKQLKISDAYLNMVVGSGGYHN